ncbi:MAG: DUF4342 domain-containing protein [Myxococcota bacterium]
MADPGRTVIEEFELAGRDLIACVQKVVREGNVRRVILRDAAGTVLIELPLAAGVAVGGAMALAAPAWAGLGAMAALLTNCRLQVVRTEADLVVDEGSEEPTPDPSPADHDVAPA